MNGNGQDKYIVRDPEKYGWIGRVEPDGKVAKLYRVVGSDGLILDAAVGVQSLMMQLIWALRNNPLFKAELERSSMKIELYQEKTEAK